MRNWGREVHGPEFRAGARVRRAEEPGIQHVLWHARRYHSEPFVLWT